MFTFRLMFLRDSAADSLIVPDRLGLRRPIHAEILGLRVSSMILDVFLVWTSAPHPHHLFCRSPLLGEPDLSRKDWFG